jgi:hypothetical protein
MCFQCQVGLHCIRELNRDVDIILEKWQRELAAMSNTTEQKTYHKKANGPALNTVKRHSKDNDLKLFGGCFW